MLSFVRLLLNTRLNKAIETHTTVCYPDLRRGRATTSLFHDITMELDTHFKSLCYLWYNLHSISVDNTNHASRALVTYILLSYTYNCIKR